MLVGVEVQILAAHRAEALAIRTAEDLLRERKRDRVARPAMHVQRVVREVRRAELVAAFGICRLVLACVDRQLDGSLRKAAVARAREARVEEQLEDDARARKR